LIDLAKQKAIELQRWQKAHVRPEWERLVISVARHLVDAAVKPRYQKVAEATGVPWPVIAVIHEREASQSWSANLAQGDPWNRASIHQPRGRGPFHSWEEAAIDALEHCPPFAARWSDWSISGALCLLEQYNGEGYWLHGMPSPYLWSGTDQYTRGKYTSDGHLDPFAVDKQIGCVALLMAMAALDSSVNQEWQA
jgi:lysozyme family protein